MADYPLIDQASLLMVPSATKEGKLYSQLPTDGSGDFTFTRATSATRVNEEGYIEKGYENLLLQSNNFTSSSWSYNTAGDVLLTSGQTGYDGSSDAWEAKNDGRGYFRQIVTYPNQVKTFSVYAKSGNQDFFNITIVKDGGDPSVTCDLGLGTITIGDPDNIDATITPVSGATGWYRISLTWLAASTGFDQIRISVGGTLGNTIIVQDAQLNQGLVAYPYLETTTAPVYGGLSTDQPRLDYTDASCPSVLIEPSRTNLITNSEYYNNIDTDWGSIGINGVTITTNEIISPEGLKNASKLQGGGAVNDRVQLNFNTSNTKEVYSVFLKGTGDAVTFSFFNSRTGDRLIYDIDTSGNFTLSSVTGITNYDIEDYGNGWYRIWGEFATDTGATNYFQMYPDINGSGAIYIYGAQLEEGSSPTSYIPTYGSTQTRAAETLSNAFSAASTGTISLSLGKLPQPYLTVLGESFEAGATKNNIAIAYSPTALKISLNGSIVVDATGTYDTSSLSSLQLGHDNGSDQGDNPIKDLIMFNAFLTDTELNALTV